MGVSEDFYDPVLRRCLTEKPQKVANVLGQALVQLSGVGDWLLARRLRAMAEAGAVRVDEAGSTRGFTGRGLIWPEQQGPGTAAPSPADL